MTEAAKAAVSNQIFMLRVAKVVVVVVEVVVVVIKL